MLQLIGMLDSPYVRRVAISLRLLGLPFTHEAVSVFRHMERFASINPLIKAPTLVGDDGGILMDSQLILDHLESLVPAERRLMPAEPAARLAVLRLLGVALVVCEKAVQRYYETSLRPAEVRHEPWVARVSGQLQTALGLLEAAARARAPGGWLCGPTLTQADVTAAVAWRFAGFIGPEAFAAAAYPALASFSAQAEALPEFLATPLE